MMLSKNRFDNFNDFNLKDKLMKSIIDNCAF